jgi:hypothetical protein
MDAIHVVHRPLALGESAGGNLDTRRHELVKTLSTAAVELALGVGALTPRPADKFTADREKRFMAISHRTRLAVI